MWEIGSEILTTRWRGGIGAHTQIPFVDLYVELNSEKKRRPADEFRDKIGAERFEELRQGTRFLERIKRSIRRPRDRAAEPAHIFVHPKS